MTSGWVAAREAAVAPLAAADVADVVADVLAHVDIVGRTVCILIPDGTRTAPVPELFRALADAMDPHVRALRFVVALGTHARMAWADIDALVGMAAAERKRRYPRTEVIDHAWDDPSSLRRITTLSAARMSELTEGLLAVDVPVDVNRAVVDADVIVAAGPVFPHEVAGFSGGTKYVLPGVAGPDVIHASHWAGAMATSMLTLGERSTPMRRVIDAAVGHLSARLVVLAPVMDGTRFAGLFAGDYPAAWDAAVDLSAQLNVVTTAVPYKRVLAVASTKYPDLWTAAKAVYKLEPAVADGGEIVVYAPHVTEFSAVHGSIIEQVGYHVRDYFIARWSEYGHMPLGILAHSTHVRGAGGYDTAAGEERPRIRVTLATGIDERRCAAVGLGWVDPARIDVQTWHRPAEGAVVIPEAGEVLHRCELVVAETARRYPPPQSAPVPAVQLPVRARPTEVPTA
jgi:nickel-dependent lactate racemase